MKKITFLVTSILVLGAGVANANDKNRSSHERRDAVDFRNAEPIVFTEAGVEFYVFADGQFDFYAKSSRRFKDNHLSRSSAVNRNDGGRRIYREDHYGVHVDQDRIGRVRRVGNVSIAYDGNGRVRRIGSVQMTYNQYALERIGGLEIFYNRRGQIVDMVGVVKGRRGYAYSQNGDSDYGYNQNSDHYDAHECEIEDVTLVRQQPRVRSAVDIRSGKSI
jgi:hypothetical protein